MKKLFILLSFIGLSLLFFTCKKQETEPEYVNPGYDTRNRISVEVNGKVETDFKFFGSSYLVFERQYDTIPFPRYFDCPSTKEYFSVVIPKKLSPDLDEGLYIERFHPFIGIKQKVKVRTLTTSLVSPKNACYYDSTFYVSHGYIIEKDISGEFYKVNDKEMNDLTVTSYDRVSGKMIGEFNLSFDNINPKTANKEFPTKLEYRNGKFTVYVKKR
jgi:hypothetical protein